MHTLRTCSQEDEETSMTCASAVLGARKVVVNWTSRHTNAPNIRRPLELRK